MGGLGLRQMIWSVSTLENPFYLQIYGSPDLLSTQIDHVAFVVPCCSLLTPIFSEDLEKEKGLVSGNAFQTLVIRLCYPRSLQ